ncbi:hypothetical protein, partial [Klebsiella quasipneumoniae]|uniref:hypothetical protein n=1 Tax=Klebsiella quasipneumoniae TaxID=1463165 RepID=UPI00273167DE
PEVTRLQVYLEYLPSLVIGMAQVGQVLARAAVFGNGQHSGFFAFLQQQQASVIDTPYCKSAKSLGIAWQPQFK